MPLFYHKYVNYVLAHSVNYVITLYTGYSIEQYKGGKWTAIATTKNNTTLTFTVKGLAKGTTYSFRIKSFRKTGSTTEFSEYASVKAATDR